MWVYVERKRELRDPKEFQNDFSQKSRCTFQLEKRCIYKQKYAWSAPKGKKHALASLLTRMGKGRTVEWFLKCRAVLCDNTSHQTPRGHHGHSRTRIWARFEALESLSNPLSNPIGFTQRNFMHWNVWPFYHHCVVEKDVFDQANASFSLQLNRSPPYMYRKWFSWGLEKE